VLCNSKSKRDDIREPILEMWAAGEMKKAIAERLGIQPRTVRHLINTAWLVEGDARAAPRVARARGLTADDRSERILDMWAAGKRAPEISQQVGVAADVVHRVVAKARGRCDPRAVSRNPWQRKQEGTALDDEPPAPDPLGRIGVSLPRLRVLDPEHIRQFEESIA
jgi:DNA-binding CsgD family transcriptional regulator